jgi:hypothetical protein
MAFFEKWCDSIKKENAMNRDETVFILTTEEVQTLAPRMPGRRRFS